MPGEFLADDFAHGVAGEFVNEEDVPGAVPLGEFIDNVLADFVCGDRVGALFSDDVGANGLTILVVRDAVDIGVVDPRVRNKGVFNLDGEDFFGVLGNDEVIPTAEHVEHVAIGDVPAVVHADRTVDGGDVDVLVGVPSEEVVQATQIRPISPSGTGLPSSSRMSTISPG